MCGITGFISEHTSNPTAVVAAMVTHITHRGPDDSGVWINQQADIALGHARLSILDLSPAGHQPMLSFCGRYVIVFNGEIYNHLQLRARLEAEDDAPTWRGHSDTETLLACFSAWGIKATLQTTVGMFAIALWDQQARVLTLARDRMGEKPLYYGRSGDSFLFGSELKALMAHPDWVGDINRDALALFLRHNCIPAPYSIYQRIFKLPPGCLLQLSVDKQRLPTELSEPIPFWQLNDVVESGLGDPFKGDDRDAVVELDKHLRRTVAGQMLSDVPLGAFLSGGIDSSTIVALMQVQSSRPVKTFTIGMGKNDYDEAVHAKAVAKHLGTDHTELYISPEDALAVIPLLPGIYCEPFSDSSQIPTFLVSQLARQHVTVALSGDGGDELFGGYNRYHQAHSVWRLAQPFPALLRRMAAYGIRSFSPQGWDNVYRTCEPMIPSKMRVRGPGNKLHKLAGVLALKKGNDFLHQLASHWTQPEQVVIGAREPLTRLTNNNMWPETDGLVHWMMAMDAQTYMPDDILVKVDRAAMAVSLETRVPMLDHRLVEFAWRLPLRMKIRSGQGKWILRQVLYQYVPEKLIERPKMGFGVPLAEWLRGPLREWAESLLCERRLRQEGYFNPQPIRKLWQQHLGGKHNWAYHLWDILMFQAWLESHNP